jgi:hypothetical protein
MKPRIPIGPTVIITTMSALIHFQGRNFFTRHATYHFLPSPPKHLLHATHRIQILPKIQSFAKFVDSLIVEIWDQLMDIIMPWVTFGIALITFKLA